MSDRTKRNLNPTPAARVAMIIWGDEYSRQSGGSMDFWGSLDAGRKRCCELVVQELVPDHSQGGEVITRIDYRDMTGALIWSDKMVFRRLWRVGQSFTANSTSWVVRRVALADGTQHVNVERGGL